MSAPEICESCKSGFLVLKMAYLYATPLVAERSSKDVRAVIRYLQYYVLSTT